MPLKCLSKIVKPMLTVTELSVTASLTQRSLASYLPVEAGLVLADTFFRNWLCSACSLLCSSLFLHVALFFFPDSLHSLPLGFLESVICFTKPNGKLPQG